MNNLFIIKHPAWSSQAAARARLAGWVFCYEADEPLPVEAGPVPGYDQLPLPSSDPVVDLPAIKIPLEF